MKKIKYLVAILIVLVAVTGCKSKEQNQLSKSAENTSISENNMKSYRAKVSITSKKLNENYIVLNENNKNYTISLIKDNKNITIRKSKDETSVTTDTGEIYNGTIEYDYRNTDLYFEGLDTEDENIKTKTIKIDKEKYTEYDFKVTKEKFNKMMEPFKITVKKDGTGYAYVDKDEHIFLISYSVDGVNVNITYTRLVTK